MKLFDGTNISSIIKSLSKILGLTPKQLPDLINSYLLLNIPKYLSGNLFLQDFFEYCKKGNIPINTSVLQFDRVIFFHKTSFIDNGAFLREKGLIDLDKLLFISSPLSEYLKRKGVEFFAEDKNTFIHINGKTQLLNNLPCNKTKSSKLRIIARLTKSDTINLEGITGFLFLCHAKNDTIYQRINNAPEFLCDLDDCIDGIADEWKRTSIPVILKCEVDIEFWFTPTDWQEHKNKSEKSYEIAEKGFLFLAEAYGNQYIPNTNLLRDDYYPFVAHSIGIPPTRIMKFIKQA